MGALDPRLRSLLATATHQRNERSTGEPGARTAQPLPDRVGVLVKFTGEVDDLRNAGLSPNSVIGNPQVQFRIATGTIELERVEALAAVPHVIKVELGRPLQRELDVSVEEIKARPLHKATPSLTGRGVVIGVIDSGIDWRHHAFRYSGGDSRVLFLWDQALTPKVKTATDPFQEAAPPEYPTLGVEYTQGQINQALKASKPLDVVRSMDDTAAHGTHVAGIAAGDGSQAGTRQEDNCTGANTYIGVAPDAELIVVSNSMETDALGESQNLADAVHYIFLRASQLDAGVGRPCVINISQGDNLGPHDGTSLVEQAIDLELLFNPGRAVVKSAGNEGTANHHAMGTVPASPGTLPITFSVVAGDSTRRFMECWYHGSGSLDVTLTGPGVGAPTSPVVHPGDPPLVPPFVLNPAAPAAAQATAIITSSVADPDNLDNHILIELVPPAGGSLPAGAYTLTFANTRPAAEEVHCWLNRAGGGEGVNDVPRFTSNVTASHTISIPGTSNTVITVGNYAAEEFTSKSGVKTEKGDLFPSSSRGPKRTGGMKPDIAAPGVAVTAARAGSHGGCCCDCCYTFYVDKNGTSMAAPHVAGVIALMLQKNKGLDHLDIRNALTTTARAPGVTPAPVLPDNDWGFGKVDASAAVAAVPAPVRALGGGGGGGGTITYWTPPIESMHERALLRRLQRFQEWLLAQPAGHYWGALVSRHVDEVLRLINTNRRVATVWHRNGGPALVRAALQFAEDPDNAVLPSQLSGALVAQQWTRILAVWRRYASPALTADIDAHREVVLTFPGQSLPSIVSGAAR